MIGLRQFIHRETSNKQLEVKTVTPNITGQLGTPRHLNTASLQSTRYFVPQVQSNSQHMNMKHYQLKRAGLLEKHI